MFASFRPRRQALTAVLLLLLSLVLLACGSTATKPVTPAASNPTQTADSTTVSNTTTQPKVGASVGLTAPQLSGTDINGSKLQLSDFKGKAVVINFFTTW